MSININLSVHDLVDFLLRKGDIDDRVFNKDTMSAGTKLHSIYQKSKNENYLSEYSLKCSIEIEDYIFNIQGRADGIILKDGEKPIIDEIKTANTDLDSFYNRYSEWHLGQAKCYAYMYLLEKNLNECQISLTYISQLDNSMKVHLFEFYFKELEKFIYGLLYDYIDFYDVIKTHIDERDKSCRELKFPYAKYRKNQEELINNVYKNIDDNGILMIEAATGLGKTISVLYPYLRRLGKTYDKIFFTTAKGSGAKIVKETIESLNFKGLKIKTAFLNAKDKMCLNHEQACNPDNCPFTKDYYDKIPKLIFGILQDDVEYYDDKYFINIGKNNEVCPFELSLDVSEYCDLIVGDYNYVFDPFVNIDRYDDENVNLHMALLTDECHNLVPRGRAMYSASINYESLLTAQNSIKKAKKKTFKTNLTKIAANFNEFYVFLGDKNSVEVQAFDEDFIKNVGNFIANYKNVLNEGKIKIPLEVRNFYLECFRFCKIYEMADDNFAFYVEKYKNSVNFKIFCVSPTEYLSSKIKSYKSACLFSATLTPINYFSNIILGSNDINFLQYGTPFNENHLNFMVNKNISMKYNDRKDNIEQVCNNIKEFCESKLGNYMIFVPSFEYISLLKENLNVYEADIFYQKEGMNISERNDFLSNFVKFPTRTTICICVLGGSFSESIDLKGDLLIGVVILGVGFPQMSFENYKIKEFYDTKINAGFDYAYIYPGMNNVTQAVGRLMRTENDLGSVLLIDNRYKQKNYLSLFKEEWKNYKTIYKNGDITRYIKNFYDKNSK